MVEWKELPHIPTLWMKHPRKLSLSHSHSLQTPRFRRYCITSLGSGTLYGVGAHWSVPTTWDREDRRGYVNPIPEVPCYALY